jgi:hypothetical protein
MLRKGEMRTIKFYSLSSFYIRNLISDSIQTHTHSSTHPHCVRTYENCYEYTNLVGGW